MTDENKKDLDLDVNEILAELRNIIGDQALQIAMLKATISLLNKSK